MLKGVLADVNTEGHVDFLMAVAQAAPWEGLWRELGLTYARFSDVGLGRRAPDAEIWQLCQREEWLLITDNRNQEGADSLEATIRSRSEIHSLPVLTISSVPRLRHSREYAERVVIALFDIVIDVENLRGAGRLYLP